MSFVESRTPPGGFDPPFPSPTPQQAPGKRARPQHPPPWRVRSRTTGQKKWAGEWWREKKESKFGKIYLESPHTNIQHAIRLRKT